MKDNHQFQRMLLTSALIHLILFGVLIGVYLLRPVVELGPSIEEAQLVELYDDTELTEISTPSVTEPLVRPSSKYEAVAFQNFSAMPPQATPTPTSTPTPVPVSTPTPIPTPSPRPTPRPTPTPRKRVVPTPRPTPTAQPTPEKQEPSFDVPHRKPVIIPEPDQELLRAELQKKYAQPTPAARGSQRPSLSGSQGPSVTLDQPDEFPFPGYLTYVGEKIQGLWFPQGAGTISVYLIIGRNGKILKSGVDKGEGIGVEKLRESIIRAITLIKRFRPLPQEYNGMVLRVRIAVRR